MKLNGSPGLDETFILSLTLFNFKQYQRNIYVHFISFYLFIGWEISADAGYLVRSY